MNASPREILVLLAGGAGFFLLFAGCVLGCFFLWFSRLSSPAPRRDPDPPTGHLFPWD